MIDPLKGLPSDSIYGCFEETVKRAGRRPAIVFLSKIFTFSDLEQMVLMFASSLLRIGIKEGDMVMLYIYNLPQTVISWLALQRIGAIPVPVAPIYTAYDIEYLIKDSESETIICMDTNLAYVIEILPRTPLKRVIVTGMADLIPWHMRFLGRLFDRIPHGRIPPRKGFYLFMDLLKKGSTGSLPIYRQRRKDEIALMLYTGGTTGFPKGVPIPEGLFLYKALEWRRASESVIPIGDDINLLAAPLFHIIGQMSMAGSLLIGGELLVIFPKVVLDAYFDYIQRFRIKSMFAVPSLYRMILEHDRLDYYDLSSLLYCGVGGDVLPIEVSRRWFRRFGKPLYQGYGATELCGAISLSYTKDGIPPEGSAGRIVPGCKVKIVDPETMEPLPPEAAGELLGTSPFPVREYWKKPEETSKCFFEIEGETWYRTKDIVRIDRSGWLYFIDRSADIIKHKGFRVAAAEIERVLQDHPAVLAACAVGVPDPAVGERVKAFVVLKEDVKGVSSYDLIKWCRERLAEYKVPSYIEFRDMLPKSRVGKLLRRELRAQEEKKLEKS